MKCQPNGEFILIYLFALVGSIFVFLGWVICVVLTVVLGGVLGIVKVKKKRNCFFLNSWEKRKIMGTFLTFFNILGFVVVGICLVIGYGLKSGEW